MVHIAVVTVFPEMLRAVTEFGVTGRAVRDDKVQVDAVNPRDFTHDRHQTVDDRPYGGGPGMVMRAEPLSEAINAARAKAGAEAPVVYLSPQGRRLDDALARDMAQLPGLVLLAGRYEGVDERLIEEVVDWELSLGDFVMSGGEIAALAVVDAVTRLLPGALGHEASAEEDSFADGLLDCPHYTRPEEFAGRAVPKVLTSGDHDAIRRWRLQQALGRTWLRRPDLLARRELTAEERELLEAFKRDQESEPSSDA